MTKRKELAGKRFGSLVAIDALDGTRPLKWLCRCDCGNECDVATNKLTSGHTKSCGCRRSAAMKVTATTHGRSKAPEYRVWAAMMQRCTNPNNPSHATYGARGVVVCDRWLSFESFIADMGSRPTPRHTIERRDVDGPYSKGNCYWTDDFAMQAFNQNLKSNNKTGKSGVYWRKDRGRWVAKIFHDGKHRMLGSFLTKDEAVACREKAEVDFYGVKKSDGRAHG